MSWIPLDELPPLLASDLWEKPDKSGWVCGCLLSKDRLDIWFCHYHEGYSEAIDAMEEQNRTRENNE